MDGYRLGPARIDVASDDAGAARWLREFLIPWFEACPPGAGEFSVRLSGSPSAFDALQRRQAEAALAPRACFALDSQVVEMPAWSDAQGEVAVDARIGCFYRLRRGSVEIVTRPGSLRVRIGLMRVVRELATLRMLGDPGCLDLHAAAFAVKDRAVLLIGPKRAGKTTLLVNALTSGRASLLANDRVLVAGDDARAFGIPTLVSIRPDTLERFPSLESSIPGGSALLHTAEIEAWAGGGFPRRRARQVLPQPGPARAAARRRGPALRADRGDRIPGDRGGAAALVAGADRSRRRARASAREPLRIPPGPATRHRLRGDRGRRPLHAQGSRAAAGPARGRGPELRLPPGARRLPGRRGRLAERASALASEARSEPKASGVHSGRPDRPPAGHPGHFPALRREGSAHPAGTPLAPARARR